MTPDSSAALRAHVDRALPPVHEHLFGVLDALLGHEQRGPADRDPARIAELRAVLREELRRLDDADTVADLVGRHERHPGR